MNAAGDLRWLVLLSIFLLGVAFASGGYVFALAAARRQINGLGARVNREAEMNRRRYLRLCLALVQLAPEDRRERMTAILLEEDTESST